MRPTKSVLIEYHYYPVRAQALKALKQQALLNGLGQSIKISIFDTTPHPVKLEEYVAAIMTKLKSVNLLTVGSTNQLQSLSGQVVKSEKEKYILAFWDVGPKTGSNISN